MFFNHDLYLIFFVQEQSELNTSLQITMHPDGSFLCFGSGDSKTDISTPTVEVKISLICLIYSDAGI